MLLVATAHRDGRAEGRERLAVDAGDGRIAVDERRQHRQGVPLVREIHRDAWPRRHALSRQLVRRDGHVQAALELRKDPGDELRLLRTAKDPRQRQPLEQVARHLRLADRMERVTYPRDSLGHDRRDGGVAIDAQEKPAGRILDRRERVHRLAGDLHRGTLERYFRVRHGREKIGDPRERHEVARAGPQDPVDADVVVRRREIADLPPGQERGQRRHPLLAAVAAHDDPGHRHQVALASQPVDETRRGLRLLRRRPPDVADRARQRLRGEGAWAARIAAAATCAQGSTLPPQSHDHSSPSRYSVTVGGTTCPGARTRMTTSLAVAESRVTAPSRTSFTPCDQMAGRVAFRTASRIRCMREPRSLVRFGPCRRT